MNLIRWIWFGSAEVRRLNRAWATETLQRALHRDSEFFFVPRSWQDEKHLSLFLCRAQNLQSLLFYLQAIIWFVKSFAFSSQRRPVFEGSSTRRLNDQAWRLHISLLQVTKIDGKYEQVGESIKKMLSYRRAEKVIFNGSIFTAVWDQFSLAFFSCS